MESGGGRQEGVTLASVLGQERGRSFSVNWTLLDIIRQEEPNCSVYENFIGTNKKGWKSFKDKRPLRRSLDGNMWAAGLPVPVSDVSFRNDMVSSSNNGIEMDGVGSESNQRPVLAQLLRARSVHVVEQVQDNDSDSGVVPWAGTGEVRSLNHYLSRIGLSDEHFPVSNASVPAVSRSSMLRRNLSSIPSTSSQLNRPVTNVRLSEALAAEREHMQTAVSTTVTATASSAQNEAEVPETNNNIEQQVQITEEVTNEEPQIRMSLMDLLEDTDSRQIGRSSLSGDVEYYTGNIDEGSEFAEEDEGSNNFIEQSCCVCMVRHKGSAFIPCGHTFCRLCSRKLWVNRGSCPICNGFILEILDIF